MNLKGFNINITSDQVDKLIEFYRDIVGLENEEGMGPGAFRVGEHANLLIDGHSDTKGKAKEPQRVLINFMVDNIDDAQKELEEKGATFIRNKGKEEWGGIISTFKDPDGNYLQLIEYRPDHQ